MDSTACSFTFTHYRECLQKAEEYARIQAPVELIHDVDFAPTNLERFAELERTFNLTAIYFIRLHARYYNALSHQMIQTFRDIHYRFGHQLGLHFEPSFYSPDKLAEGILKEKVILESLLEVKLHALSIHTPLKVGSIDPSLVPSSLTYFCHDSPHYHGKKYLSDSNGRWREGCMCNHFSGKDPLVILTHPNWWFEQTPVENY
jgi:hypothetical protein